MSHESLKKAVTDGATPLAISVEGANEIINGLIRLLMNVVLTADVLKISFSAEVRDAESDKKSIDILDSMGKAIPIAIATIMADNSKQLTKEEAKVMLTKQAMRSMQDAGFNADGKAGNC